MKYNSIYHLDINYISEPKQYGNINLFQIGRMLCDCNTVIDTHLHINWFELTSVIGGSGVICTNGTDIPVKRGDIYLSFPCDTHKIFSNPNDPLKYDFFSFSINEKNFSSQFSELLQSHFAPCDRVLKNERIQLLIEDAITEFSEEKYKQKEALNGIFTQIIIYLIRGFKLSPPSKLPSKISDAEALCFRVMNYIDSHLYSVKNISEIASEFGYSAGYLSTIFKRTTSNTPVNYLNERKFEAARILLIEGKMKVSEIAELLNYSSVYAFSKAFRNKYGVSPKNYLISNR